MIQIAIQEDMLLGHTVLEQFEHARALGFQGVELWAGNLDPRLGEIVDAVERTGVVVAAVNHGSRDGLLRVNPAERERAVVELRSSIAAAADLGANGVVFVPHYGVPSIPDLMPYLSAEGLEMELLNAHLRVLEDYAAAMGVELYVAAVNHAESHFLNRLDQAGAIVRRRNHPSVKASACTYDMALEEKDTRQALLEGKDVLGYLHLADSDRHLPGYGTVDFAAVADALRTIGYEGWCTVTGGEPGSNHRHAARFLDELPASVKLLNEAGFGR